MARRRIRSGDVFTIPLGDDWSVVGQIVFRFSSQVFLINVRDHLVHGQVSDDDIRRAFDVPVRYATEMVDTYLITRKWDVVTTRQVAPDSVFPNYVVGRTDRAVVESFDGGYLRDATAADVSALGPRRTLSNVAVLNAVREIFLDQGTPSRAPEWVEDALKKTIDKKNTTDADQP